MSARAVSIEPQTTIPNPETDHSVSERNFSAAPIVTWAMRALKLLTTAAAHHRRLTRFDSPGAAARAA